LLAGPVVVNEIELAAALTFLVNDSQAISADFVPLRILLNYALKNPRGFFKIDTSVEVAESKLAEKIEAAAASDLDSGQ
jgi:hypothetical protein